MLSADEIERLIPAETARFCSPIPTPSVSSDEFMPAALARAEYDLLGRAGAICDTATCKLRPERARCLADAPRGDKACPGSFFGSAAGLSTAPRHIAFSQRVVFLFGFLSSQLGGGSMQSSFARISALALAVMAPSIALAQEQARVISSVPVWKTVTVPERVCSTSQVMVPDQKSGVGAVMGAIAGGVIGNSVGQGSGRAAATALGLVGGAALGDRMEEGATHARTVQNCATQMTRQNRIDHYSVAYEFAGKQYRVAMASDPGPFVTVQVAPLDAMRSPPVAAAVAPAVFAAPPLVVQDAPFGGASAWAAVPAPLMLLPDASQTGFAVLPPPAYSVYYAAPAYWVRPRPGHRPHFRDWR